MPASKGGIFRDDGNDIVWIENFGRHVCRIYGRNVSRTSHGNWKFQSLGSSCLSELRIPLTYHGVSLGEKSTDTVGGMSNLTLNSLVKV